MTEQKTRKHRLTTIDATNLPRHMIFVDTETVQHSTDPYCTYQDLRLGVAMYWCHKPGRNNDKTDIFRFTDARRFWEFVISKVQEKEQLIIFAHNAVFDMIVLQHIHWLNHFGYKCIFVFDQSKTFIAKWKSDTDSIMILNTGNWFLGALEVWGKELGLPKLTMPDVSESNDVWFEYCERDTEVLLELTKWYFRFLTDNDLGPWGYTIASQAFKAFRHRFMKDNIVIPDNEAETRLARAAYKGGRTEVFKVGEYSNGPFYKVDVNSMYPYVMRTQSYPINLHNTGTELSEKQIKYLRGKYGLIAHCRVTTDQPFFVESSTGRNVYPIGTFDTYLTTNEFYLAFDNGWLDQMYSYALYGMRPIFKRYVDFFYGLKVQYTTEGKRLQRAFTKLYLNSLYGKFGQKGYKDEIIGEVEIPGLATWFAIDTTDHSHYRYRLIGNSLIRSTQEGEARHAFCAIAAHVTANARLLLYNAILKAGREHVYYSDTDSMIVDAEGYARIQDELDPTRLGAWAIEATSEAVTITAPKHYLFDGKWTMKGVRHNANKIGDNTYEQEIWPGFSSILKSGTERYYNKVVQKTLSPEIRTGRVMPNGDVLPLVMNLEPERWGLQPKDEIPYTPRIWTSGRQKEDILDE